MRVNDDHRRRTHGSAIVWCLAMAGIGCLRSAICAGQEVDPVQQEIEFGKRIATEQVAATHQETLSIPAASPQYQRNSPPPEPRNWNLTLLTAYEYDSNLASAPSFSGLGDDAKREDSRWLTAAFGEYRFIQRPGWNAGVIGSAFDSFHFDYDDFNVEDYMGGAYNNLALGSCILGVRYEFHETRLGGEHLASDHRLVPNLTYAGYDWGHSTVYYEFDTAASNAPALIPAQIQSGVVNAIGATQALYTYQGQGRVYFGYRYEDADTDGDDFDRHTHMVTGRVERPIGQMSIWDAEIRHFWHDYLNPNSLDFFGRPRSDTRVEVRTGLQRNLNDHWAVRLDYTFVDAQSNVANLFDVHFYQYDRHILSSQLIFDF